MCMLLQILKGLLKWYLESVPLSAKKANIISITYENTRVVRTHRFFGRAIRLNVAIIAMGTAVLAVMGLNNDCHSSLKLLQWHWVASV